MTFHQPAKQVRQPVKQVHQPVNKVRQPGKKVHQPGKKVRQPGHKVRQPVRKVLQPSKMAHQHTKKGTPKACGVCGKVETKHWSRHWRTQHLNIPVFELGDGEPYEPWCENWHAVMEALLNGEVAPEAINKDLRTGRYGATPDEQMDRGDVAAKEQEKGEHDDEMGDLLQEGDEDDCEDVEEEYDSSMMKDDGRYQGGPPKQTTQP
jgi:hypothetical protein